MRWLRRRDPQLVAIRRAARVTLVACAGFTTGSSAGAPGRRRPSRICRIAGRPEPAENLPVR